MKNNSSTVAPSENDSQWTTDVSTITVSKGEYLWTKIVHRYYSDPKTEV
jgi:hypothetical protein